jgi:hypothetical protein
MVSGEEFFLRQRVHERLRNEPDRKQATRIFYANIGSERVKKQRPPLLSPEGSSGNGRKQFVNEFERGNNHPGPLFFAMPDPATHSALLSTDLAATLPTAATGHTNSLVPNEQSNNVRDSVPAILESERGRTEV